MIRFREDYSLIESCILQGNKKRKLKIYQEILNGNTKVPKVPALQELIDCGLVIGDGKNFKVRNPVYEQIFNKEWIQTKLTTTSWLDIPSWWKKFILIFLGTILAAIGIHILVSNTITPPIKVDEIKEKATEALNTFDFKTANQHKSLFTALESGTELNKWREKKNINKFNFEEYPTVKPILALQKISDEMTIKKIISQRNAPIRSVAFSPDGNYIAFGGEDKKTTVYNIENLSETSVLNSNELSNTITSICFHPTENILAVALKDKFKKIKFFRILNDKLKEIGDLDTEHGEEITKIIFSQNGNKLLTAAKDGLTKVWNLNYQNISQSEPSLNLEHGKRVEDAIFYDNEKLIITAGEIGSPGNSEPVKFWNSSSGQEVIKQDIVTNHKDIKSVSLNYDEDYLATAGDNGVCIWKISSSNTTTTSTKPDCIVIKTQNNVSIVDFSHWKRFDNILATAGEDGNVQIWDISGSEICEECEFSNNERAKIKDLSFSPNDSSLVTVEAKAKSNNKVILWDLSKLEQSGFITIGNENDINNIYFAKSNDDRMRLIVLKQNSSLEIWELESKNPKSNSLSQQNIIDIAVHPDKKHLAILFEDKTLQLWNLSNGAEGLSYEDIPFDTIKSIKYGVDHIAILEEGNQGYFIERGNDDEIIPVTLHEEGNQSISMTKDGSYIATLGKLRKGGQVKLWKWKQDKQPIKSKDIASGVKNIFFSPDSKYLILEYATSILQLRTQETNFTETREDLTFENISSFAFSDNGDYIAIAQDSSSNNISKIQFRDLSEVSKEKNGWIELDKSRKLAKVQNNGHNLLFLPMNDKIKLIATAEEDKSIHLWDLKGRELAVLKSDHGKIIDLEFSDRQDKETYLIAIEEDAQEKINVQYWDINQKLDIEKLIHKSCKKLDQNPLSQNDMEKLEKLKLCAQ